MLLTVPNISEGRDRPLVERLAREWRGLTLLDLHMDADHGRSVLSFAGEQGRLGDAVVSGAAATFEALELDGHDGLHPHVGVLDVCPIVYPDPSLRGAAVAEALVIANTIGAQLEVPVFLYGDLADGRERSELRAGGPSALALRMRERELVPDFGPSLMHPSAGATLVTARPPLVAFNVELERDSIDHARSIAAQLREAGGGFKGVRAIGLWLEARNRAQVSFNVHDPFEAPLGEIVEAVAARSQVAAVEIVGMVPKAAFESLAPGLELLEFDHDRQVLEVALEKARRAALER